MTETDYRESKKIVVVVVVYIFELLLLVLLFYITIAPRSTQTCNKAKFLYQDFIIML